MNRINELFNRKQHDILSLYFVLEARYSRVQQASSRHWS